MLFSLSRPLADSEKLPVRSHRAAEALKSPGEDGDTGSAATHTLEPRKKRSKEKREEKKKDKDGDRKVRLKGFFLFCY